MIAERCGGGGPNGTGRQSQADGMSPRHLPSFPILSLGSPPRSKRRGFQPCPMPFAPGRHESFGPARSRMALFLTVRSAGARKEQRRKILKKRIRLLTAPRRPLPSTLPLENRFPAGLTQTRRSFAPPLARRSARTATIMATTRSKRYRAAAEKVDAKKAYSLSEAVGILKGLPPTKFDQTVTLSFRLGVDPRQSDQMVRGTCPLPHGSGKNVRVLVFAQGNSATAAREAGRRVRRVRGPHQEVPGRLPGFRRRHRHPGRHVGSPQARQGARAPRPHAEPEDRHRDR